MKNITENRYENITDFPETAAEGVVINDEEYSDNNSIVEINFNGLAPSERDSLCSMTIVDELENTKAGRNTAADTVRSLIDIERLTMQIDGLTSVKKSKKKKLPEFSHVQDTSLSNTDNIDEITFSIERNKLEEIEDLIKENEIPDSAVSAKPDKIKKQHIEETDINPVLHEEPSIEDIFEDKYTLFEEEAGDTAEEDHAKIPEAGVKLPDKDEKYHTEEISGLDSIQQEGPYIKDILEDHYAFLEDETGNITEKEYTEEPAPDVELKAPEKTGTSRAEEIGLDQLIHNKPDDKGLIEDQYAFSNEKTGDIAEKDLTTEIDTEAELPAAEKSITEEKAGAEEIQPDIKELIEDQYAFLEEETENIPENDQSKTVPQQEESKTRDDIVNLISRTYEKKDKNKLDKAKKTLGGIRNIISGMQEEPEETKKDSTDNTKPDRKNTLTIEIPEKLMGLPPGFNIDELGKIDLNEAEIIAEEDILSFTKGVIPEELKDLDILPEHNSEEPAKDSGPANKKKNSPKNTDKKIEKITADAAEEDKKPADYKESPGAVIANDNISNPAETSKDLADDMPPGDMTTGETPDKSLAPLYPEDPGNETVLIIDNKNFNIKEPDSYTGIDELEAITSDMEDNPGGKAKQLTEADNAGRKSVTGLIRDNYPTFTDLFKEKELEERRIYADDDVVFVDDLFIKKGGPGKTSRIKGRAKEVTEKRTTSLNEQILGLIPDELKLIEDELFNISSNNALKHTLKHPVDSESINKYKYILPDPDSLLAKERKSIEDDISSESALILEEDVDKIKKKLEDSMKKKIEETIQDITDKITIYEDNKINNKAGDGTKDKEEIKKLLKYLDELLEKLPEDAIKKFADSEYYELYKKVLKNTDK